MYACKYTFKILKLLLGMHLNLYCQKNNFITIIFDKTDKSIQLQYKV